MTDSLSARDRRHRASWQPGGLAAQPAPTQMVAGLMIMGVGIALVLDRFSVLPTDGVWPHLWPLLLIGLGVGKLLTAYPDGRRRGGGWLLIGAWLLLNELHIWRAGESWPLFLVAVGITLVWKAVRVSARRREELE